MKFDGEIIKVHCPSCSQRTNQLIRAKFKPQEQAEYENFTHNEYCISECLGCNHIAFIHQKWDEDDESKDENGDPFKWASHYVEDERWFEAYEFLNEREQDELPVMIYDMYSELADALQHELKVLSGVGMRMLVESVCIKQKIPGRNLKIKIQNLFNEGMISKNDFEVLDKLRDIGNISAHQIKCPSDPILEASLEAVNHLLRTIYIVPKRTKRLKGK